MLFYFQRLLDTHPVALFKRILYAFSVSHLSPADFEALFFPFCIIHSLHALIGNHSLLESGQLHVLNFDLVLDRPEHVLENCDLSVPVLESFD